LNLPVDSLEDFVLSNASDIRLVIGFFFYAFYARYQTQRLLEWTEILAQSKTDPEIYAVSLFLNSLRIDATDLPPFLRAFIAKHLLYHGHPALSAERLTYAFHKEHGVKWFFIRSIINIDPAHFAFSPLVRAEFAARSEVLPLFESFLRAPDKEKSFETWVTCFIALVSIFLRPSLGVPYLPFPVFHPALTALTPAPQSPQRVRLDPALLDLLLIASERPPGLPVCFFQLFFHLHLESPQRARIRAILTGRPPASQFLFRNSLPSSFFAGHEAVLDDAAKAYFSGRPPSFAIAFFRSLKSPLGQYLPPALVTEIWQLLPPIFPEFGFIGCPIWASADHGTRILRGWIPQNAVTMIARPDRSAIQCYHAIMRHTQLGTEDAATRALLAVAVGEGVSVSFAADACDAILMHDTDIIGIISQPGFLNSGKFANVLVICARVARKHAMPELLEALTPHVEDERKRAIIGTKNAAEALALS
jgi:hypothetical protein